jgi:UDP-glucose 4-epimerase
MIERAVVTGAAGFIGSNLVTRLAKELGVNAIGLDNEQTGDWSRVDVPCTRIDRDLVATTADELQSLLEGNDVLFHLAAEKYNSSSSTPQRVIDVNISATHRLFSAAATVGLRKVVFTSSLYAYGSLGPGRMKEDQLPAPTTTYGVSKIAGEHLLRVVSAEHDLDWTVARLFFVYGPRQWARGGYKSVVLSNFERIRRGEPPTIFGDGNQTLDYVYVDDAIDALLAMCEAKHRGITYNVGTGRGISIRELTDLMLEVAGSDLEPITCPPDWTADSVRVADPGLASDRLGWTPSTSMSEGLRRVWHWMQDRDV